MRLPFRKPLRALAAIGRWRPFAFVTHRNPVRNGMDSPPSVQTKRENQFFGSPARSFGCYRPVSNPGHLRLHPVSTSGCAGKHHSVNCSPSVSSGVGSAPSAGIILAVAVRLFQHSPRHTAPPAADARPCAVSSPQRPCVLRVVLGCTAPVCIRSIRPCALVRRNSQSSWIYAMDAAGDFIAVTRRAASGGSSWSRRIPY